MNFATAMPAFAASAATAVATAQHAGEEALRRSLEASEADALEQARVVPQDEDEHPA